MASHFKVTERHLPYVVTQVNVFRLNLSSVISSTYSVPDLRYIFVQNFIKLIIALHELSC